MNKKLLLFDAFLGILFGITVYFYVTKGLNFETLSTSISSLAPMIINIGMITFRIGLYKTYKKTDNE